MSKWEGFKNKDSSTRMRTLIGNEISKSKRLNKREPSTFYNSDRSYITQNNTISVNKHNVRAEEQFLRENPTENVTGKQVGYYSLGISNEFDTEDEFKDSLQIGNKMYILPKEQKTNYILIFNMDTYTFSKSVVIPERYIDTDVDKREDVNWSTGVVLHNNIY